jgi:hypothetical protein
MPRGKRLSLWHSWGLWVLHVVDTESINMHGLARNIPFCLGACSQAVGVVKHGDVWGKFSWLSESLLSSQTVHNSVCDWLCRWVDVGIGSVWVFFGHIVHLHSTLTSLSCHFNQRLCMKVESAELGPAFKLSHFEVPPQCRAVVTAVHMGSLFHHIGLSHCRLQSVHAMHAMMVCHSADRSQ